MKNEGFCHSLLYARGSVMKYCIIGGVIITQLLRDHFTIDRTRLRGQNGVRGFWIRWRPLQPCTLLITPWLYRGFNPRPTAGTQLTEPEGIEGLVSHEVALFGVEPVTLLLVSEVSVLQLGHLLSCLFVLSVFWGVVKEHGCGVSVMRCSTTRFITVSFAKEHGSAIGFFPLLYFRFDLPVLTCH